MLFPKMLKIAQTFDRTRIFEIPDKIKIALGKLDFSAVKPGARIAVTVGSRGIADISGIIKSIVASLHYQGFSPFVFPAMGSHGGATADGQSSILAGLGITEEFIDAPVISSMEVDEIGRTPDRIPVFVDKKAMEADYILVVNRQKIDFDATYANCITSISLEKASIPVNFETDRHAIEVGLYSIGLALPEQSRVVRIKDTLHLDEVEVSNAYLLEIMQRSDLKVLENAREMTFNSDGNLDDF